MKSAKNLTSSTSVRATDPQETKKTQIVFNE